MSFQILANVDAYVHNRDDLRSSELSVLRGLASYANTISRCAYPAIATLQKYAKLSRRTIQYALRSLEAKKLIAPALTLSKYGTVIYQLLIPSRDSLKSNRASAAPKAVKGEEEKKRAREIENREKTSAELEQLSAKGITDRFRQWLGLSPTGSVQAILTENA